MRRARGPSQGGATSWRRGALAVGLANALVAATVAARADDLAIRAGVLHPVSAPPIEDARVLVRDGRIVAVAPASELSLPAGWPELRAAVVTPGLIDTHSSVGLSGLRNVAAVLDQDERSEPDQADLRALDAFNPRAPLLAHLLEHGITLVHASPGPEVPIAGQAGLFRTHGESADAMAVRFPTALVFNLGEEPKRSFGARDVFPGTRMGTAALIRRRLAHARSSGGGLFRRADDAEDAGLAVLRRVARRELPALFVADRADDIETALRIGRELDLRVWLAGATEAYLVTDALRAASPQLEGLFAGPVMERVTTPERERASFELPARLAAAGLRFGLRSGFEAYVPRSRVVLFEAAVAVANGLDSELALRALTLDAARMLGVSEDYGAIEPDRVADLALFDGDPFEYTSHVIGVVAAGRAVVDRSGQLGGP